MGSSIRAWLTVLFVAAALVGEPLAVAPARAQEVDAGAPSAADLASSVQTFYDHTTSVEADFQQFFWTRVYDRTTTSRGRLRISRPGRIRFDYTEPSGKVVVGDGSQITYYEPGDDGAAGQYYRGSTDAASRALGFLTGTSRLDRDFTFVIHPSTTGPAHTSCLELRPRTADPHFTRVRLYVSTQSETRGVVMQVAIEDPDGNWNTFRFSGFHFNRELAADTFTFTPPSGAREITAPASH
jgi:outer membrane lipoprotein carrier protein